MTPDFIRFHAAQRPDAVAVVDNGQPVTYSQFAGDIRKVAAALAAFELPRAAKVALDCSDRYHDWLLRLACEELCLVSTTFAGRASGKFGQGVADFDLVLSDRSELEGEARRFQSLGPDWIERALAIPDTIEIPACAKRPEDPLRILLTSGTTGTAKRLLYSRQMHERSIEQSLWYGGFTQRARYLLVIPFTVGAPAACLRMGGTVVLETRMSLREAIAVHAITHTTVPPIQLVQMLETLPEGFVKPTALTILSFGAAVAKGVRERALARIATEVLDLYGTNEVGFLSAVGDSGIGTIWPGAEIEIVDDRGRVLPYGELGRIRVRTDCMPEGYLDDPEATSRHFRSGWFYVGDMGVLQGPRRLRVVGRSDDLLNIGWNKIVPEAIEALVLDAVGAADIGVCALPNADGVEEIHVAFAATRLGDQTVAQRLQQALARFQLGRFYAIRVPAVPRNGAGKIERDRLKSIFREHRAMMSPRTG